MFFVRIGKLVADSKSSTFKTSNFFFALRGWFFPRICSSTVLRWYCRVESLTISFSCPSGKMLVILICNKMVAHLSASIWDFASFRLSKYSEQWDMQYFLNKIQSSLEELLVNLFSAGNAFNARRKLLSFSLQYLLCCQ